MWCLPAEEHNTGNKCKVTVKDFFSKNEALQEIPSTGLLRVIEVFFPNEKYFQQHGAVIYSQGPHFCCEWDWLKSDKRSIQPWVLSPGSSCESEPAEECYNRADACHTSPRIFQGSSFCHPGGILNQLRVLVTFSGNLFTSLCSPRATINWLLSKTSFLMELQTSTCFVYAESGICEVNLMPTQLFCGKKEWTFNLSCHSCLCKLLSYCPIIFQTEESSLVAFFLKQ